MLEKASYELPTKLTNFVFVITIYYKKWSKKWIKKKNDVKNMACYYLDYIMRVIDIDSRKQNKTKISNLWDLIQNFYGFNAIAY